MSGAFGGGDEPEASVEAVDLASVLVGGGAVLPGVSKSLDSYDGEGAMGGLLVEVRVQKKDADREIVR